MSIASLVVGSEALGLAKNADVAAAQTTAAAAITAAAAAQTTATAAITAAAAAQLYAEGLVRVGFSDLDFTTYTQGTGSASSNKNAYLNRDGTGYGINISLPSGLSASNPNYAQIYCAFYGKTVGVRFRDTGSTINFGVIVDGTPYEVPKKDRYSYFDNNGVSGLGANKEGVFFVRNLPDGHHSLSIVIYPDQSASKSIVMYGLLLEKTAGYSETKSADSLFGGAFLTSSDVAIPVTDMAGVQNRGVKKIIYRNTDTLARTVLISWNSSVVASLYLQASGISGDTQVFDLSSSGLNPGTSPSFTHKSDVSNKVSFVCTGAM